MHCFLYVLDQAHLGIPVPKREWSVSASPTLSQHHYSMEYTPIIARHLGLQQHRKHYPSSVMSRTPFEFPISGGSWAP